MSRGQSILSISGKADLPRFPQRFAGMLLPLLPRRPSLGTNSRVIVDDIRPAKASLAKEIYGGTYRIGDDILKLSNWSPFASTDLSGDQARYIHSFRWLRHMTAAETHLSSSHALVSIFDWVRLHGKAKKSVAWDPDVIARRIIAWHQHMPKLAANSNNEKLQTVYHSIWKQTQYLDRRRLFMANGPKQLHVAIAIVYSALCMGAPDKYLRNANRNLERILGEQILSDGTHISRNPSILAELLADLLPLKNAFIQVGLVPGDVLLSSIDRMAQALAFFRHSGGTLAQFNGTGPSPDDLLQQIDQVLEQTPGSSRSALQGGFERMEAKGTVLLMDTGYPNLQPVGHGLAGCLSFELSSGGRMFVINCGVPANSQSPYPLFLRATAGHSTVTLSDTSSIRQQKRGLKRTLNRLLRNASDHHISCQRRDDDEFQTIDATHDGYLEPYGVLHRRILQMSQDGRTLNGTDRFEGAGLPENGPRSGEGVTIRFHLPPDIAASRLANGYSILLAAPEGDAWTLSCVDAPIGLEESIQFSAQNGPRKSEQIVIRGNSNRNPEIRWVLQKKSREKRLRENDPGPAIADLLSDLN